MHTLHMHNDCIACVVVGRDVTPVVGMKVCQIVGGCGKGASDCGLQCGERTGAIEKVIARVSARSQSSATLSCGVVWEDGGAMQLMKTGLGGNYDLILSPHDPSHPSSVVAASHRLHKDTDKQPEIDQLAQTDADQQPQTDANQQPALFLEQTRTCSTSTAGSDVGQAPQDNGFSEQQHDQTAGVLKDGHGEKEPQQASRAPQDESPASEEGKEAKVRGQKNLMKLRAAVKAVTATYEFAARTHTRIESRKQSKHQGLGLQKDAVAGELR